MLPSHSVANMLPDPFSHIMGDGILWTLFWGAVMFYFIHSVRFRFRYDWHKIPAPPGLPLVGDLFTFLRYSKGNPKMHEYMYYWWRRLGRPKMLRTSLVGFRRTLVVCDPSYVQHHISSQHGLPKSPHYDQMSVLFGPNHASNILLRKLPDKAWRTVRKSVSPAFSTENLKKIFPKVVNLAGKLVQEILRVPGGQAIDIQHVLVCFAFEVISTTGMGVETNAIDAHGSALLDAQIYAGEEMMRNLTNPFRKLLTKWVPFTTVARRVRKSYETLYAEIDKLYGQIKSKGGPSLDDTGIAACLLRAQDASSDQPISDEELKSEAAVFFAAGTDTTAYQIAWALCCIATHDQVQAKVAAEVVAAGLCGPAARGIEFADLAKLTYLNAVIKEVLRMLPVVALGSSRYLEEDTTILGHRVPKGTYVAGHAFTLNRSDALYADPDTFDPDRWINNELPTQQHDVKSGARMLWTFSHGPRDCIGQRLAIMEMQIVLALLLGKFKVVLGENMGGWEGAMDRKYDMFLSSCKGGIWVKFLQRE